MINLKGLTLQEAKEKLKKSKIPIGYIQDIYAPTKNPSLYGKIFDQTIKVGTLIGKPKYIGVKIYSMPKTKMPDLTRGWSLAKAKRNRYLIVIPSYTKVLNSLTRKFEGQIFKQDVNPELYCFDLQRYM